jgi:hypothetical protein
MDKAGTRYEISKLSIKSVRVTKIGMRKALNSANPLQQVWGKLTSALTLPTMPTGERGALVFIE